MQLEAGRLARGIVTPEGGWIRAIRAALGMSAEQLGRRLGMGRQAVGDMERREAEDRITLETLRRAAEALNCDVYVAMVPRAPVDVLIRNQAAMKAAEERAKILQALGLKEDSPGVAEVLNREEGVTDWLTKHRRKLWDL
jgi:predicted DNA-binding mobile mystery protein A